MPERYSTEYGPFTWHPKSRDCPHENEHACPTCDFDGYYQAHIPAARQAATTEKEN